MATLTLDVKTWAEQQFGMCDFGDQRRTQRAVKLAAQVAVRPDAPTPKQTETWSDCKAAYRLFDQEDVTFDRMIAPHCMQTRAVRPGTWLVIDDTTELDFGYGRSVEGLGRVGNDWGRGFLLHSAMLVAADGQEIVGMAAQELFTRPVRKAPRKNASQRKNRSRESEVWGRVIDRVGPPAEGVRFIHICDRGADNFEVYCHLQTNRSDWVIRAAQLHRLVLDAAGKLAKLHQVVDAQPCVGNYELEVRANHKQPARHARIEVRICQVTVPQPRQHLTKYLWQCGIQQIPMYAIEAREVNAPVGVKPLRWVLLTSEKTGTYDEAWRVIEWYEKRQLIEEYHKCLKTGCRVEARQYGAAHRLQAVVGLLSVVAVRLLQLKLVARKEPDRPVAELVPTSWVQTLRVVTQQRRAAQTVGEFFRRLAMFGGFLGRKGDGEPGWQTIWSGLEQLHLCVRTAQALARKCG